MPAGSVAPRSPCGCPRLPGHSGLRPTRIGGYQRAAGRLVWRSSGQPGHRQEASPDRRTNTHGHRTVAQLADGPHRWLGGRVLPLQAHRQVWLAGARALRRPVEVHRWPGGLDGAGDHLAGVQRLGRLQPVSRARRRASRLGGLLRQAVSTTRCLRDALRRGAGRGGRRKSGSRSGLPRRRRPGGISDASDRGAGTVHPRARRVLDAVPRPGRPEGTRRWDEPGLPRRQHHVLEGAARPEPDGVAVALSWAIARIPPATPAGTHQPRPACGASWAESKAP